MSGPETAVPLPAENEWSLYLVRTRSGSLYCGISKDVRRRFQEHCGGGVRAARALRGRGPLTLVYQQKVGDQGTALRLERRVKKLPKVQKEKLVRGEAELPLPGL